MDEMLKKGLDCGQRMPLIGDKAPDFEASSTDGPIKFPNDYAGKWVVFFSHPSDFTPVCTTEFIAFQNCIKQFEDLNAQLLGLSVGGLASHLGWLDAISKMNGGTDITFPLIDDLRMDIAKKYGMIQPNASDTHAVRAVFIIDTKSVVRAILYYPAVLGRNVSEILRILVGLQTADAFGVAVPANWMPGLPVLSPAPDSAIKMRKNKSDSPWFLTYKELDKDVIYSKICKSYNGKE